MIRLSVDQALWTYLPFMTTGPLRPLFPSLKESPAFGDAEHLGEALRQRLASAHVDRPWFTTVFFSTAHFPYAAPHPGVRTVLCGNAKSPVHVGWTRDRTTVTCSRAREEPAVPPQGGA